MLGAHAVIRTIPLRRRRSRVPWVYSVYHARRDGPQRGLAGLALRAAERAARYTRSVR